MPSLCILLLVQLLLCSFAASGATSSCSCCDDVEISRNSGVTYSFPSSSRGSSDSLELLKDAEVSNGALQLTSPGSVNKSGAVLLRSPVTLWLEGSQGAKQEATFETSFTMGVVYSSSAPEGERRSVEGLAFVIVPSLDGGVVGLTNTTTTTSTVASRTSTSFIAVEFHTAKQPHDPGDDNYISLNVGSMIATSNSSPSPANSYTVWINYDGVPRHIRVYMAVDGEPKPHKAHLDAPLTLSDHVPRKSFIGFTASTDAQGSETHAIMSWNLTVKLRGDGRDIDWKVILPAVLGAITITFIMNISVAAFYFNSKYKKLLKMELELSDALRRLPGTPREFKYAAIRKATNNFHEERKLGKGGFGAVYKGTLRSGKEDGGGKTATFVEVAVKKFTRNENRCYGDFLAEVDIINRLRHRNIVPLVGWCYEKGELLLIYEYMPNGSLDQHLMHKEQHGRILGWTTRYNVVMDVAAGLHYVHHEHEHMVLHRDIKASNIMLDSTFRGRLGDFGLARIVGLDKNSYTDLGVAGTWGFIAPEYSVSHKATRKSDVYAFGVLILEIVTGRHALEKFQETFQVLTDWVWKLHREGKLLQAVDREVISMEDFDADDASRLLLLGLACSDPNPSNRPSMTEVVQVVSKSVVPPEVPLVKPTFVWPPEGGIPLDFSDVPTMSNFDGSQYWDETSSCSEALALSVSTRRKACVVQPSKSRSTELCCVRVAV